MSNITDMIAEGFVDPNAFAEPGVYFNELVGKYVPEPKADNRFYRTLTYDTDEIVTNKDGGKQSKVLTRFDLVPPTAISEVASVLRYGAERYGERNWELISVEDHLNHALQHIFAHLRGQENGYATDLSHAATRLLFALDIYLRGSDDSEEF